MAWAGSSDVCISVYGALQTLHQIDSQTTVDAAGPLRMQDLQFYNTTASGDINNASALSIAKLIDVTLANSFAASYQPNIDTNGAVNGMVATLQDAGKTVENLSDAVAELYAF
ncbi:MAG: hypothetical protein M3N14_11110 [Bacteroidota bacterium]|nr:hypothetical protein [Bacteroidota bacterium]